MADGLQEFLKPLSKTIVVLTALAVVLAISDGGSRSTGNPTKIVSGRTETAVFAGGCFWGLQAAFDKLPGVIGTRVGYTGGQTSNPTYEQVVAGTTGHAEAVEVVFDPARISYEYLVRYFFKHHRFASDEPAKSYRTRSYRSEIFVSSPTQRATAERVKEGIARQNRNGKPVATLIENAGRFWEAEAEHQKYLSRCGL